MPYSTVCDFAKRHMVRFGVDVVEMGMYVVAIIVEQ